jgi:hypothetical protein
MGREDADDEPSRRERALGLRARALAQAPGGCEMRGGWKAAAAACVALGLGSAAHAGPLASASLVLAIAGAELEFGGVGATGTATSDRSATLSGDDVFVGLATASAGYPFFARLFASITNGSGGTFSGAAPDAVGGTATVTGRLSATDDAHATPQFRAPLKLGRQTVFTRVGSGLGFTVFSAPWTAGAATIDYGNATTPATLMITGMNALTPSGVGALTLVSPGKIHVTTGNRQPIVGILTLTYVPEPSTALLLAGGALGLGALGRRRRTRETAR